MGHLYFIVPLLLYVAILVSVAYVTGRVSTGEDRDYFLAGKTISPFRSFLSVVATETSVATIVIFPGVGAKLGFAVLWLPLGYIIGRILIARFYLSPLYHSSHISIYATVASGREGGTAFLSGFYLVAKYIGNGVRLFLGGYAIQQLFGWDVAGWICVSALAAGIYSLTGGLRAVVLMDQIQGYVIYLAGLFFCAILYFSIPESASFPFQPLNFDFSYSNSANSVSMLLGGIVLSIGTHGADQDLLQRILGTRSLKEAQFSLILSGFGAFVVILIYLLTGYLLNILHPDSLDPRSPLIAYIRTLDFPLFTTLLAILIFAASSSTLDSSIHSTGAVWKELFRSSLPGRFWSFVSLACLVLSALLFIRLERYSPDFLSLAMGSMNYINGGLIGIFTVFTFFSERLHPAGIVSGLLGGFFVTVICNWSFHPAVAWTWTILLSSFVSFLLCYGWSLLYQRRETAS